MATYLIGDIQGCFLTLQRLLERIEFDAVADHLVLLGDLVNRGPHSLEVLRWAHAHRGSLTPILGNHELHLLAASVGVREPKRADTLERVLAASDCNEIVEWIRGWPLLVERGSLVLVHAAIHPAWSLDDARTLADKASRRLRGDKWQRLVAAFADKDAEQQWSPRQRGNERAQTALRVLTRARCFDDSGRADYDFAGPPEVAPAGLRPWYTQLDESFRHRIVVFGHWAALGYQAFGGALGLDSGCVYGGTLTALRADDLRLFQEPLADPTYWSS